MHEMGIVLDVVKKMDAFAEANHIPQIHTVVMSVGELSALEPPYFVSCWEYAASRSDHLVNCGVRIDPVPGIAKCMVCGEEFNLEQNDEICPKCKSEKWRIISGREVMIKEVLVEE
ncbi:MAG: hydrogenase maturation nickel metallochaperone HypA [Lachnospiraceae bacterium]|nr:hydrogenase maturation nickel metallochaperone HypA [Lachnospiraceae bacterium]